VASRATASLSRCTELAKVDPSVSVLCDVHNTLVDTVFRVHASEHLQKKYLPQLSEKKVRQATLRYNGHDMAYSSALSACPSPDLGRTPLR
jgi:hypothetical protein